MSCSVKITKILSNQKLNSKLDKNEHASDYLIKTILENTTLLLQHLIWNYNVSNKKFRLVSSDFGFNNIPTSNFNKFLNLIKPCFQNYFANYLSSFCQSLINNPNCLNKTGYQLQCFIPMRLELFNYHYVNTFVIPKIIDNKIIELHFISIPLKEYANEVPVFNILKHRVKENQLSQQVNNKVSLDNLLTVQQLKIFNLLILGYSSSEIANRLNKKRDNILRYNARINSRMSSFFEIPFNNVNEATDYYKKSFMQN